MAERTLSLVKYAFDKCVIFADFIELVSGVGFVFVILNRSIPHTNMAMIIIMFGTGLPGFYDNLKSGNSFCIIFGSPISKFNNNGLDD